MKNMFANVPMDRDELSTHYLAWTSVLHPKLVEDPELVIELARKGSKSEPDRQQNVLTVGAALLRAGQHEQAAEVFAEIDPTEKDGATSLTYLAYFQAINEWKLGRYDAARQDLAEANALADQELSASPIWNRKLTIQLLRTEAENLIEKPNL
ncbi:MAG: hypothetical protein ACE361_14715 [Aureliella sp.]